MNRVTAKWFIGSSMVVVLVAMVVLHFVSSSQSSAPDLIKAVMLDPPRTINEFNLIDHQRQTVTRQRFVDHWTFVFFGFTNCPDVCPATLAQLVRINGLLKERQELNNKIQFYFVSVDPQRDTLEHLAEYIAFFDQSFVAMTGDEPALRHFESELGSYHRIEASRPDGNYNVQHSADIFLIDPAGRLTAKFSPPMEIAVVVKQFDMLVHQYAQKVI
jgi:protein SCO1/2